MLLQPKEEKRVVQAQGERMGQKRKTKPRRAMKGKSHAGRKRGRCGGRGNEKGTRTTEGEYMWQEAEQYEATSREKRREGGREWWKEGGKREATRGGGGESNRDEGGGRK